MYPITKNGSSFHSWFFCWAEYLRRADLSKISARKLSKISSKRIEELLHDARLLKHWKNTAVWLMCKHLHITHLLKCCTLKFYQFMNAKNNSCKYERKTGCRQVKNRFFNTTLLQVCSFHHESRQKLKQLLHILKKIQEGFIL